MTNPGKYKHRISFHKNAVTVDKEGFKSSALTQFLSTKCEIPKSTFIDNNRSSSKDLDSKKTMLYCNLRYNKDIDENCIAEFNGKKYKIASLENVSNLNHELKLVLQNV